MAAIARGLMASERLLLMDEPSSGLAPLAGKQLGEVIKEINQRGERPSRGADVPLVMGRAKVGHALQTRRAGVEGPWRV